MGIKHFRPLSPAKRGMTGDDFSDITKSKPEKSLTVFRQPHAGRDNQGRISIRHKGGGARRRIRLISTLEQFLGQTAKVAAIEYDPNRNARIALVEFDNKVKAYILAPTGLKVGDEVIGQENAPVKIGNRLKLKFLSPGTEIYDIEIMPGSRSHFVKSAGGRALIQSKDEKLAQIKLPSKEIRKFFLDCWASVGSVSNPEYSNIKIGKAGRQRHKGKRPTVRGKAMNPYCHPHGGGEGGSPIGMKHPKTKWGKPALGVKTRHRKKISGKFIVKRRVK
ncbi:MAG: 50S ribosomal protein L2 [Candidatus Berkelbacteria bacterium Licking1014_2]|uniref:Large ribosomal subunit protein uL2 n=1 Tax=Candidatus Berkelbacteria bacterium Licking1014_2 TaxID=2017146 RepID=A0A554LWY3_9BACT|nr:MAG: 50S ribosomal protein L2 [Candidatus Berkelbacteria bacterium Licking1014_2]